MANTFIFDDDEQPDMGGGMTPEQDDDQPPEEGEGGNRTFTIIMIVIGVLFVLAILCAGGYFLLSRNAAASQASLSAATDAFVATQQVSSTQTQAALPQASPTLAVLPTETPTTTPVVVIFETPDVQLPTDDPEQATLAVQNTSLAQTQEAEKTLSTATATPLKGTPGKSGIGGGAGATPTTKIPQTGFADEVGLPVLVILTVLLLGVILLARRLRAAPGR